MAYNYQCSRYYVPLVRADWCLGLSYSLQPGEASAAEILANGALCDQSSTVRA